MHATAPKLSSVLATAAALGMFSLPAAAAEDDGIDVGGAVRFQYSYENYDEGNRDRVGDIDLDTVRINFDGSIGDVLLSAEWRYYQYMQVIHHGWVGYEFTDELRGELGITKVPFGNLPFNSHGFFFSSNYYLGLEDDYDAGIKLTWLSEPWDVRVALFKNDEMGGVDGYVSDRTARYSYDVISDPGAGDIGETNTLVGRVAYAFGAEGEPQTEVGLSALTGRLHDDTDGAGSYFALGPHVNADYGRWNLQLQAAHYEYDLDSGSDTVGVGAYAFEDGIPAKATSYTAHVGYRMPISLGPVSTLTFYSDNSWVTDKSDDSEDTLMNVLGISAEAGGVFAYLDFVSASNQPFIGGSMVGDSDQREERLNLNVGYYF